MRFGAAFIPGMSTSDVIRLARTAEELGYDDLWIPDQTFHWDPFVLLGLCARATSRIRLGVAVTNPYTRHPVQIARAAAVLSELAEGRFVLGLGAGNRARVLRGLGAPTNRAASRLDECIEVCRRLLRGERVTIRTPTLTLDGVKLDTPAPSPVPIYVGSRSPRVLRLAGARADGVFMEALFTPGGLDFALAEVEAGARSAGRRLTEMDLVVWQAVHLTTASPAAEDERVRNWAAMIINGSGDRALEMSGIPEAVRRDVRSDLERFGEAGAGRRLSDDVVARVLFAGTPSSIVDRVREVRNRGVDTVSIISFGNTEVVLANVREFALRVMAEFAS